VPRPLPEGAEKPPSFKADVEELLPLPDATQSLPRIPLAAVFPLGSELEKKVEGRSLFQVAAFALVVLASALPVLRYTGVLGGHPVQPAQRSSTQAPAAAAMVAAPQASHAEPVLEAAPAAPAPTATRNEGTAVDPVTAEVMRIEASLPSAPDAAADVLVAASLRALDHGEERLAETLLARALKLDDQNPRAAYALARIRLAQNNLEGAEGWVLAALRLRPKRAEYHALYADILAKQGHASHAKRERRKARSLRE
jgi:tetratricopeptide (TPR) repeat protein